MNETIMHTKPHHGRNLKRVREILGVKQEALALTLGNDWTQRRISLLEQKEEIEDPIIEEVAGALKVSSEAIKNFNEEAAVNFVSNTFNSHDYSTSLAYQSTLNFNPIEKIVQLYEEKEKLYQEKIELYERMLKDKEDIIETLSK